MALRAFAKAPAATRRGNVTAKSMSGKNAPVAPPPTTEREIATYE
jgi:hypothetical protein